MRGLHAITQAIELHIKLNAPLRSEEILLLCSNDLADMIISRS